MTIHKKQKRYHNLGGVAMRFTPKKMWQMTREYMKKQVRVPPFSFPSKKPDFTLFESGDALVWLGHSTLLGRLDGVSFIVDPMFSDRASPFACVGPKRFDGSLIDSKTLPPIDVILITHNHYDHLDRHSMRMLHKQAKAIYLPLDNVQIIAKWGIRGEKVKEFDWYEEIRFGNVRFAFAPSQHFSGRGVTDRNRSLWGSWAVQGSSRSLYFSGDGGYNSHFKTIGERYGPFDLACLECGAYNDAWREVHMAPEETVRAAQDLGAKVMMPIHWAGFSLSTHAWDDPVTRALAEAKRKKVTVTTPMIGETVMLDDPVRDEVWWDGV